MSNLYEVLGLTKAATKAEIKKAYQKAASKNHPDKGGDAEKFKEVQAAYDTLYDDKKRASYDNPQAYKDFGVDSDDLSEILRKMREAHQRSFVLEIVVNVDLARAFHGFEVDLDLDGVKQKVRLPAGIPNGARGQYTTSENKPVIITARFAPSKFETKHISEAQRLVSKDGKSFTGSIDSGPVLTSLELDALDIILGCWITVKDFLGESYSVRVPAGFNPDHRLKLAGKGYLNWSMKNDRADPNRADMFIRVIPIFKPVSQQDHAKALALVEATKPAVEKDKEQK